MRQNDFRYANLFSEGKIGSLQIKNRILMGPTETLYGSACGEVTNELIEYYRRRAQGGVGMIILHSVQGNTAIDKFDPYAGSLRIDNDAFIPRMSDLTEAVHREGAYIAMLCSIGGGAKGAGEAYLTGVGDVGERVSPSDIAEAADQPKSRALTREEILRTVEEYGRCAKRAKAAGFDAFFIHAVGSYLLAEFLSPLFNCRTDEYGGSAENRWRILFELIQSCRKNVGKDYPIVVRMSVDEMTPGGRSLEETKRFLLKIIEAGIDALDITVGMKDPLHTTIPNVYMQREANWEIIAEVKRHVNVPVICAGKLYEPQAAEYVLRSGTADFVSIGRGLIADPDWPLKVRSGKEERIRRCLSCNYCIGHRIMKKLPLRCAFNPYAGREWAEKEPAAPDVPSRNVVIIGGGPAGLEAAKVLGLQGHNVDIYEAADSLCGGQIRAASSPPCKEGLLHIPLYYQKELQDLKNVHIHLNRKLDCSAAAELGADCYIVATGALPLIPRIEGVQGANVFTAEDALLNGCEIGKRVLILGGGQVGAETAHLLSERGKEVTIVDRLSAIAVQEEPMTRGALLKLLQKNGVRILVNKRVTRLTDTEAYLKDTLTDEEAVISFDTALLALGTRSDDSLARELTKKGFHVYVIGDSAKVGNIAAAISQAHTIAERCFK